MSAVWCVFLKHFPSYTVCDKSGGRLWHHCVSQWPIMLWTKYVHLWEKTYVTEGCKQFTSICYEDDIFCVTDILMSQVVSICLSLWLQTPQCN